MTLRHTLLWGCAALMLCGLASAGAFAQGSPPQAKSKQDAPSGWDGRPVTRSCRADAGDLGWLKAALIEHEKTRIGFKNKLRRGVFSGGELSGGGLRSAAPALLLGKITQNLAQLEDSGRTVALVYDLGVANRQYVLCVWLISTNGVEEAVTVPIADQSPFRRYSATAMVRNGLGVEGRSAARSPRLRSQSPDQHASSPPPGDVDRLKEDAWRLLVPQAIAARLQASDAVRLLILPVSDIGLVPFAALPLGDRLLIDRFALVLLPDVEALFDVSSSGDDVDTDLPMSSIIVGDPDLSHDRRWEFPPLQGARSEAMEVARLVEGRALFGEQASKANVLEELRVGRNTKLIYMATHALSDAVNPMDGSFLGLAGDHLYGRDIKALTFSNNPLVVMSACQTGLGKVFEGGTFGLVRAWYYVGAPRVVMSLWNIDDDATKEAMVEFMRRHKAGERTEFALQRAMQATKANEKFRDPALWAGLAMFGLPSRAPAAASRIAQRVPTARGMASERPTPSINVTIGVPQGAVLHEEDPDDKSGRRYTGSTVWWINRASPSPGGPPELSVRAELAIPERNLTVMWSLRRNTDPSLPANLLIEVTFSLPAAFPHGGVESVPGVLMKSSEAARGTQLAGLAAKVSDRYFVIGLSAAEADARGNAHLLKTRSWFDLPIVYDNGRRAILAFEKGASGDSALREALAAWGIKP